MRFLFLAFWLGVVTLCGIAWKMHVDAATESEQTALSLVVIGAVGCAALAAQTFIRPNLDGTSLKSLALSYRARFMMRLGLSEAVMLIAFAVSRQLGPWWVVLLGVAFTVISFARLAPTTRHLQQDQDRLSLSGCQLSLTEALRTPAV